MFLWQHLFFPSFLLSIQTIHKHALINFTLRWSWGGEGGQRALEQHWVSKGR